MVPKLCGDLYDEESLGIHGSVDVDVEWSLCRSCVVVEMMLIARLRSKEVEAIPDTDDADILLPNDDGCDHYWVDLRIRITFCNHRHLECLVVGMFVGHLHKMESLEARIPSRDTVSYFVNFFHTVVPEVRNS